MGIKQVKATLDDVPVIVSVPDTDEDNDPEQGVIENVQWQCLVLPEVARLPFLKAAGIRMPDELNKPGTHDMVIQALRVALSDKDVLRRLTDQIVRATKEMYDK